MHKAEVLEFLGKIDAHVSAHFPQTKKFPLRIIGKSALLLADFEDTVGTVDLDSLAIEAQSDQKPIADALLKEFGRSQQLVHGYYLEFVGEALVFLPPRAAWLSLSGPWKSIQVEYLEIHEVIASKCFSAFSTPPRNKDKKDITSALDQGMVETKKLIPLIDRIFDYYSMDARSDRFEKVFDFVNSNIIANHGGGPLTFTPDND